VRPVTRGAYKDLTGNKFGKLTVISQAENKKKATRWNTVCDCGNYHISYGWHLVAGNSLSCGCLIGKANKRHGVSEKPEHYVWCAIKQRCYNTNVKNYKYYGGRGIKVCDRWLESFENFIEDMGVRP